MIFLSLSISFFHPRCVFVIVFVFILFYLTQAILPFLPLQPFPNWRNCMLSGGQCKKNLLRRSLLVSGQKETPAACSPCCLWWDRFCGAPGCSWMWPGWTSPGSLSHLVRTWSHNFCNTEILKVLMRLAATSKSLKLSLYNFPIISSNLHLRTAWKCIKTFQLTLCGLGLFMSPHPCCRHLLPEPSALGRAGRGLAWPWCCILLNTQMNHYCLRTSNYM